MPRQRSCLPNECEPAERRMAWPPWEGSYPGSCCLSAASSFAAALFVSRRTQTITTEAARKKINVWPVETCQLIFYSTVDGSSKCKLVEMGNHQGRLSNCDV